MNLKPLLKQLGLDPLEKGLQVVHAQEVAGEWFPRIDTDRPALLFHVDNEDLQRLTRTLSVNYPADHAVKLAQGERTKTLTLGALSARRKIMNGSVLYLPPLTHPGSPLTLANIMARLRAPNGGCPWDLEQTHESITRALVEETYEVIEAISEKDMEHLKEELGDLFLHVLFQTQIARDENEFSLSDVGAELAAKLIRRHPHVFGDEQAENAGWVLENWEKIKQEEKKRKGQTGNGNVLDAGIPRNLPALTRAQKIAERARRRGADGSRDAGDLVETSNVQRQTEVEVWSGSFDGLRAELKSGKDKEAMLGAWLLELAVLGEENGIDAERALNAASKRFANKKE